MENIILSKVSIFDFYSFSKRQSTFFKKKIYLTYKYVKDKFYFNYFGLFRVYTRSVVMRRSISCSVRKPPFHPNVPNPPFFARKASERGQCPGNLFSKSERGNWAGLAALVAPSANDFSPLLRSRYRLKRPAFRTGTTWRLSGVLALVLDGPR